MSHSRTALHLVVGVIAFSGVIKTISGYTPPPTVFTHLLNSGGDKIVNGVRLIGVGEGEIVNGVRVSGSDVNGVRVLNMLAVKALRHNTVRFNGVYPND